MWGVTTTMTFSALLRTPHEVIDELDNGDVVLTRRDGDALRLSKASSVDHDRAAISALAQLIAASLDDEGRDRIVTSLAIPFPWIEFLPDDAKREFADEFVRTAHACASVGQFQRLTIVINAWEATAEACADGIPPDGSDLDFFDEPEPVPDPRSEA